MSAGDSSSSAPNAVGGSATFAAGTASASSLHSYIRILGTDVNGQGGDVEIISTGSVSIQAPLQVSGSSTLGSTQAASLQVVGSTVTNSLQAASLQVLGSTVSNSLQVKGLAQVDSDASVGGSLSVAGDVKLGNSSSTSRLSINAVTTFESTASPITSNAAIIANAAITANATLTVAGRLQASGDAVIGTTASNTLTVNAVTIFTGRSTLLYGDSSMPSASAMLQFQRRLSTLAVSPGTVLGKVQFTGWDGAVDGLGAQIRSVMTVSSLVDVAVEQHDAVVNPMPSHLMRLSTSHADILLHAHQQMCLVPASASSNLNNLSTVVYVAGCDHI